MDKYGQKKTIKMKDKLIKKLNYFISQVNSGDINTGLCKDVVSKVKSYVETTETELSNRELDTFTEIRNNEPLRMMLIMSGIYLPLIIEDDTIRFLFNNHELMAKNQKYSLPLIYFGSLCIAINISCIMTFCSPFLLFIIEILSFNIQN